MDDSLGMSGSLRGAKILPDGQVEHHGLIGDIAKFIRESDNADIIFAEDGTIVAVEVPPAVNLTIVQTDPGMKGDTATGGTKPAKLETGAMVNVPLFLNEGDMVKVDTRTGQYMERVKK